MKQLKNNKNIVKIPKSILRINMAQSMDGHTIQPDGKWALGSTEDKRRMDRLRLWANCIIASRKSIENDNPNLFARRKPGAKQPMPVIILKNVSKKISASSRIFNHPHPAGEFWVYGNKTPQITDIVDRSNLKEMSESSKKLLEKWKVFSFKNVKEVYSSLTERKFYKILLEGGPSLNGLFLQENLIDEIFFTIEPYLWAGQTSDRIITTPEMIPLQKFRLLTVEHRKNEVFFKYKRIKNN